MKYRFEIVTLLIVLVMFAFSSAIRRGKACGEAVIYNEIYKTSLTCDDMMWRVDIR